MSAEVILNPKEITDEDGYIDVDFDVDDITTSISAQSIVVSGRPEVLESINEFVLEIDETTVDGTQTFDFSVSSCLFRVSRSKLHKVYFHKRCLGKLVHKLYNSGNREL